MDMYKDPTQNTHFNESWFNFFQDLSSSTYIVNNDLITLFTLVIVMHCVITKCYIRKLGFNDYSVR